MKQKSLSKWLKFIIIGIGICAIFVYGVIVPMLGQELASANNGEFEYCFWPWFIFILITAIPCFAALYFAWRISDNIGEDRSFSYENSKFLKYISILAAGDAGFFFAGNIVFLFLNMNHPGIVLFSQLIVFVGIAISVAAAALSHLVMKAACLQEENDLTI